MAISLNEPESTGRRARRRLPGAMAEINIIPLVDVVLVLLVIFMLTAHVMEYGLEIEVPKVAVQPRDTLEELPVVSLTKRAELYLNGRGVNINQLPAEVRRRFPAARAVYVQADRETIWEPVAQVMGVLGKAKIEVRAVTRPMEPGPAGR